MRTALLALLLGWSTAAYYGELWERALVIEPIDGVVLRAQSSGDDEEESDASQKISRTAERLSAQYSFKNFNGDRLRVSYEIGKKALDAYENGWGYRQKDIAAINAEHETARQAAHKRATALRRTQAQFDAELAALARERDQRVDAYFKSKGFKILNGKQLAIDMPLLVRGNAPLLRPVASAIETIADQRKYDSEDLIGAVASFVQTGLIYRIPPPAEGDRRTGGILPPVTALVRGWGDCDTKTGLAASILSNWPHMRMVGIGVPGHYLLAALRIPGKGDLFVEHQGLQYVLIEPAGPAWLPPGQAGQQSIALLESGRGYDIEPFF